MSAPFPMKSGKTFADVLLCNPEKSSPQWGVLGESRGERQRVVAMDLNTICCTCLIGEPESGKSYAMGVYNEMALIPIPGVNILPRPLAGAVIHYSKTPNYKPELAASFRPNDKADQIAALKERYGADPAAVKEIVLLCPMAMVDERREEFGALDSSRCSANPQDSWEGIRVERIAYHSPSISAAQWQLLMGVVSEKPKLYQGVINQTLRECRASKTPITLGVIRDGIQQSSLPQEEKNEALTRLKLAAEFIDDDVPEVNEWLKRGRMVIVDLRDEFLEKNEALSQVIIMMQKFADQKDVDGSDLQKLITLDEAHKYLQDAVLVEYLTEIIREMRHKATSILIASQDPLFIPAMIIELCRFVILLKMGSPRWLEHIQRICAPFTKINVVQLQNLQKGEAYVAAKYASEEQFTIEAQKVQFRHRATRHGGDTRTALPSAAA